MACIVKFALGNGGGGGAVGLGDTCFRTHSKCHERHLWPGAIVCVDVVCEILGIAWIVKSASGNGGVDVSKIGSRRPKADTEGR